MFEKKIVFTCDCEFAYYSKDAIFKCCDQIHEEDYVNLNEMALKKLRNTIRV